MSSQVQVQQSTHEDYGFWGRKTELVVIDLTAFCQLLGWCCQGICPLFWEGR